MVPLVFFDCEVLGVPDLFQPNLLLVHRGNVVLLTQARTVWPAERLMRIADVLNVNFYRISGIILIEVNETIRQIGAHPEVCPKLVSKAVSNFANQGKMTGF